MQMLIGPVGLAIRVAVIWASGWLAQFSWATYSDTGGTLTVDTEGLVAALTSLALAAVWWVWRKVAKLRGGKT
jgi:hypothetical protein